MIKRSIAVSGVYATGLICSFLNQIAIAFYFGSGVDVDLYFAALSIATFAAGLASAILSFGLPAMLVTFAADEKITKNDRAVATSILWMLIVIGLALGLILLLDIHLMAYPTWFSVADTNGRLDSFRRLVVLSWTSSWINLFIAYFSTLASLRRHQVLGGIAYAVPSLLSIGAVILYHQDWGLAAALVGQIVGLGLCAPLLLAVTKDLWTSNVGLSNGLHIIWSFLRRVPWYAGATLCFTVYPLVDAYLTASLSAGEYSSLAYSQRLTIAAVNLIIAGPSLMLVKRLCGTLSTSSNREAQIQLITSVRMIMILITPIAIISSVFANQLVQILFQHGRFNVSGTEKTGIVFAAMSPGMVFMSAGVILSRGMVALGRERIATGMSLAWILLYVLLSSSLNHWYRAQGIAWAYTGAWSIVTCIIIFNLSKINKMQLKHQAKDWTAFLFSAAVALLLGQLSHYALVAFSTSNIFCVVAGSIAVFSSYTVAIHFTGAIQIKEFNEYRPKNRSL